MSLLALPTEISSEIFRSACLDDGRTARTLCLVSRHCHELAKPLLFRSISVCGIAEMRAFAKYIKQHPEIPRTMRHLFLSEKSESPEDGEGGSEMESKSTFTNFENAAAETLGHIVNDVFDLVSPFLETLSYLALPSWSEKPIHALHTKDWRRLVELTIQGCADLNFCRPFPSLERLHLYKRGYSRNGIPENFADLCPRLTHLKASGFGTDGRWLAADLRAAWKTVVLDKEGVEITQTPRPIPQLPPHLRCIILQPANPPTGGWCGTGRIRHGQMVIDMEALANAEWARGLVVEKGIKDVDLHEQNVHERAMKIWLSRLNGGLGCWMKEGSDITMEDAKKSIDVGDSGSSSYKAVARLSSISRSGIYYVSSLPSGLPPP